MERKRRGDKSRGEEGGDESRSVGENSGGSQKCVCARWTEERSVEEEAADIKWVFMLLKKLI